MGKWIPQGLEAKYGVVTKYGRNSRGDFDNLPLSGLADGSTYYDMDSGNLYMFSQNEDDPKNEDGEWILQ